MYRRGQIDYGGVSMAESLSITELAELVGMTVRNIRAYQSRGLLFPPEIRGRTAHYGGAHVARLELIGSLQREGFTLAAIKRLIEMPESYSSLVADRRRRFRDGSADMTGQVPISETRVREMGENLPERLLATGLAWREGDQLFTHTVLAGVGRTLSEQGVQYGILVDLQLASAELGARLGRELRERLISTLWPDEPTPADAGQHLADLARVAVQLYAAGFEIAFVKAATRERDAG